MSGKTFKLSSLGLEVAYRQVASLTYSVVEEDVCLGVAVASDPVAITLPADVSVAGKILYFKDVTGSCNGTNTITITPASGTIDGAASYVISDAYGSIYLISNGTNWFALSTAASSLESLLTTVELDATPGAEYEWVSFNPKVNGTVTGLARLYHLGFASIQATLFSIGAADNEDPVLFTASAPASNDNNGAPLIILGGDAGEDDAGTGGNNGGDLVLSSGNATDAEAASGLNGGDAGDLWIGTGAAGAGDGAGVSGAAGVVNIGKAPFSTLGLGPADITSPIKAWHQVRYVVQPVAAATDTVDDDAVIVHVTYTGTGAVTNLELPTAGMVAGRVLHIKDAGGLAGTNNITVTTEGAETIDGAAQYIMNNNYEAINLYTDGSNWFVF